ncbi:MAG: CDP-alcohol phosphatidyltransferase family protein [Kofleriaceae bacterium]
MWLAHALSLSRIPIAIGFWWAYGTYWAVVLIALAALTDTLDGNVARAMKRRGARGPDIGGWLDPLVDKVFVTIVLVMLWLHTHDALVIVLIGARELLLLPLLAVYVLRRDHQELRADPYGKLATVAQFIALAVVLAVPTWALAAAGTAAVFGVIAVAHYVWRAVSVARMQRYTRPVSQREMSTTASTDR